MTLTHGNPEALQSLPGGTSTETHATGAILALYQGPVLPCPGFLVRGQDLLRHR